MIFNKTLIVTGYGSSDSDEGMTMVRNQALKIMGEMELDHLVSNLHGGMNGTYTFMVATSGSKEGWGPQQDHTNQINKLMSFIDAENTGNDLGVDYIFIDHGGERSSMNMEAYDVIAHSDCPMGHDYYDIDDDYEWEEIMDSDLDDEFEFEFPEIKSDLEEND